MNFENTATHVSAAVALGLWVADLLYAICPDNPEGVVDALTYAFPRLEKVVLIPENNAPPVLTICDNRIISVTLPTGQGPADGFDIIDGRLAPPPLKWFIVRVYNLRTLFESRAEALQCMTKKPQKYGPTTPTALS